MPRRSWQRDATIDETPSVNRPEKSKEVFAGINLKIRKLFDDGKTDREERSSHWKFHAG